MSITKWWFVEATYEAIKILLQECEEAWTEMEAMGLDEATEYISNKITELLDIVAPIEMKELSKQPVNKWVTTQGLKISLKSGNNQYKTVQAGRKPKEEYTKYKKILGNALRASKQLYYKPAIKTATTDKNYGRLSTR